MIPGSRTVAKTTSIAKKGIRRASDARRLRREVRPRFIASAAARRPPAQSFFPGAKPLVRELIFFFPRLNFVFS
jgi:hypothetical protein